MAGGQANVATILAELPDLDGGRMAALAAKRSRAEARRLGWLLELVRTDLDLDALDQFAQPDHGQPTLIASEGTPAGSDLPFAQLAQEQAPTKPTQRTIDEIRKRLGSGAARCPTHDFDGRVWCRCPNQLASTDTCPDHRTQPAD